MLFTDMRVVEQVDEIVLQGGADQLREERGLSLAEMFEEVAS